MSSQIASARPFSTFSTISGHRFCYISPYGCTKFTKTVGMYAPMAGPNRPFRPFVCYTAPIEYLSAFSIAVVSFRRRFWFCSLCCSLLQHSAQMPVTEQDSMRGVHRFLAVWTVISQIQPQICSLLPSAASVSKFFDSCEISGPGARERDLHSVSFSVILFPAQ